MVHLVEARVVSGYVVRLRFSDGVEGRVDLGQELHGLLDCTIRSTPLWVLSDRRL